MLKQKLQLELQQSKPGQLEIPKLRKTVKEVAEPEKKEEKEVKDKPKKIVKKKKESDYDLPDIPDYERPELEKYEKSEFDPSRRVSWEIRPMNGAESTYTKLSTEKVWIKARQENLCFEVNVIFD